MVGQRSIQQILQNTEKLPSANIFLGIEGCGKSLLVKMCADKFGYEVYELDFKELDQLYNLNTPTIFYCYNPTIKQQNILLKLLEDTPVNVFIVIKCTTITLLLETIINRCFVWKFSNYTEQELSEFTQDEKILSVAKTPGMVLKYIGFDFIPYETYSQQILDILAKVSWGNLFKLIEKPEFDSKEKIDLFILIFENILYDKIRVTGLDYDKISVFLDFKSKWNTVANVDYHKLFENFIIRMKQCSYQS